MHNVIQPFLNLSKANATLITDFVQSREMVELATASAEKYFELAQRSFGRAAASAAHADLVRRLTENYSNFAKEYSESLIGTATAGQKALVEQVQAASESLT